VLHEGGYKCGNPVCRCILTLDIHHLEPVSANGADTADNLLALCPTCHALHHRGEIPVASIRAWKMLQLAVNEAYDRKTIDLLFALDRTGPVFVSGDGLLACAALVASGLVAVSTWGEQSLTPSGYNIPSYRLSLGQRGESLLAAWKEGNQAAAIRAMGDPKTGVLAVTE
jgi:HNH endonuclease